MDLKKHFYSFEGRSDSSHGNSGEEAGGRSLGDGILRSTVYHRNGGECFDKRLANVVAPEGYSNCSTSAFGSQVRRERTYTWVSRLPAVQKRQHKDPNIISYPARQSSRT